MISCSKSKNQIYVSLKLRNAAVSSSIRKYYEECKKRGLVTDLDSAKTQRITSSRPKIPNFPKCTNFEKRLRMLISPISRKNSNYTSRKEGNTIFSSVRLKTVTLSGSYNKRECSATNVTKKKTPINASISQIKEGKKGKQEMTVYKSGLEEFPKLRSISARPFNSQNRPLHYDRLEKYRKAIAYTEEAIHFIDEYFHKPSFALLKLKSRKPKLLN